MLTKDQYFPWWLVLVAAGFITACSDNGREQTNYNSKLQPSKSESLTVYKSPTCGCCGKWVKHVEKAGFHPLVKHPNNLSTIKNQFNIEPQYQSCHTAVHSEYVFEGHIPVKFIQQFLDNPPTGATGLAVPAMPAGTPGMEAGQRFTPYTIYQLNADGEPSVFASVSRMEEQY